MRGILNFCAAVGLCLAAAPALAAAPDGLDAAPAAASGALTTISRADPYRLDTEMTVHNWVLCISADRAESLVRARGEGKARGDAVYADLQAAKACGSQLTGDCVIEHAGSVKGWTGGGIIAPVDTHVGSGVLSQCFVLLKATADGFVLAPEVTKPNHDIFNCDPANVVEVTDTHTGG